jgi:SAM-dependent methyltransferase
MLPPVPVLEHVRVHTGGTDPNRAADREWTAARSIIPWLAGHVRLDGARVLEYGCGDGQVSRTFAPHVASVVGLDIDADAVRRGARELERRSVENVALHAHPAEEIVDALRARAGEVDIVLLYAVVEHLAIAERLAVLEAAREVARPDGVIVCVEAPNRLVSFDGHSSQLPYMNWLPYELGRLYGERSPRPDYVEGLLEARRSGPEREAEWWVRYGRGVSFHEFELAFGDLARHVIGGGYDTVMWPARPLLPEEVALARDLGRRRPDLGPMWSRHWLDVVLTPDPHDAARTFVRPWTADTGESEDVSWTRWDTVALHGPRARLRARPPQPTRRLVTAFAAPVGESVLGVVADGATVAEVPTTAEVPHLLRYVEVRWDRPAELVECRLSTSGHVFLLAFEH